MPGFFGVVDSSPSGPEVQRELDVLVKRMSTAMHYESAHSDGILSYPTIGACVGYVGLVEETAPQNTVEPGVTAVTTADGGVRVRRVATPIHTGADGLEALLGKCAAFLADPARAQCLLFNDRYGRERLFLHVDGRRTFFSSEAKAILAVAPRTRGFDPVGLAEFLACGCTLGSRSLFRDIEVLEGGTIMTFEKSIVSRRRYSIEPTWKGSTRRLARNFSRGSRGA